MIKALAIALMVFIGLSSHSYAESKSEILTEPAPILTQKINEPSCDPGSVVSGKTKVAGQGCCSSHNGECGCNYEGRTTCCDGTVSPSCKCFKGDHSSEPTPQS